jgi:hypothetical protein
MSGYMVTTPNGEHRNLWMVNAGEQHAACEEVMRRFTTEKAHCLAPVSDEILRHFGVQPGTPWLFSVFEEATGKITHCSDKIT